ncbi:MAG: hypothetical protein Tsb0013_18230 [Phycisphaerales bacterium]
MRTAAALSLTLFIAAPALAGPHDLTAEQAATLASEMQDLELRLVHAGDDNKQPLRYTPRTGADSRYTVTQGLAMSQEMAGMPAQAMDFPPTIFTFTASVKDTPDNAPFTVVTTLDDARMGDGGNPMMRNMMGAAIASMKGMTTTDTVDTLGKTVDSRTDLPDGADPNAQDQIAQLESLLTRVQFPEQPVAPGAVWHTMRKQDAGGFEVSIISTFTLEKIEGDTATLSADIHQVIPSQKMNNDNLPPGATATIKDASGAGSATMTVDLTTGATVELDMTFNVEMDIDINMQGQSMSTSQTVDMTMTAQPAP